VGSFPETYNDPSASKSPLLTVATNFRSSCERIRNLLRRNILGENRSGNLQVQVAQTLTTQVAFRSMVHTRSSCQIWSYEKPLTSLVYYTKAERKRFR